MPFIKKPFLEVNPYYTDTASTATKTALANPQVVANFGDLNSKIAGAYTLHFDGFRKGGGLGAGDYDMPMNPSLAGTDDGSTGDRTSLNDCVIASANGKVTLAQFSFRDCDATVTCYIRKNGVKTTLGTVTSTTKVGSFTPSNYTFLAGDKIILGFTVSTFGNYTTCTSRTYIRQA